MFINLGLNENKIAMYDFVNIKESRIIMKMNIFGLLFILFYYLYLSDGNGKLNDNGCFI